jgi:20S proteasome alpha/beta subunit
MLKGNQLYEKSENRYLRHEIDYKMLKLVKNDMTYILGAKCTDGVVLVGDTKIAVGEGTNYEYGKKLFKPFTSVVMGASGASGLFSSFQNRMTVLVRDQESRRINLNDHEKLKTLAENVIREMHNIYEQDRYFLVNNLNVLMAIRVKPMPELVNITGLGLPEPVNTIKVIGHGEPYGALFIKKMWNPNMTMEQTAKLALFVIKLIQDTQIDASVGYRTENLPQVYYLPNVIFPDSWYNLKTEEERKKMVQEMHDLKYPIQELPVETVNHFLNEVSSKVSDFDNLFKQGQFKI